LLSQGSFLIIEPNAEHTFLNESKEPLEAIMFKTNHSEKDTYSPINNRAHKKIK
jgi:mannose-6-phosphate isomerase-like protein (cupin superfamily)